MKFTIRDIMWLTVVVALAVGWLVERSRLTNLARDVEVYRRASKTLAAELQGTHPKSAIYFEMDGKLITILEEYEEDKSAPPNSSVPAPNSPTK
ncbi:MAG: hypothetical protein ACKVP0_24360 [Pirellulaceae bacterium]